MQTFKDYRFKVIDNKSNTSTYYSIPGMILKLMEDIENLQNQVDLLKEEKLIRNS